MNLAPIKVGNHQAHRGQVLILFVFSLVVLVLFVGLGIDVGFAYLTKASLSKGVDAAALSGVRYLSQGQTQASAFAASSFAANYGRPGRDVKSVTPSIQFETDANNNTIVNVSATATINTFFIRILPAFNTLTVSAYAQATRAKLLMSLVLDRSGSMDPDHGTTKGGRYLPGAVTNFISNFDDDNDEVALVSFASTAIVDVPIGQPFKSKIINWTKNPPWSGGTFSFGGLTNGFAQGNSVVVPSGQNAVKVVVFFTDGLANMIQDSLNCPPQTLVNFGGYDFPNNLVGFFDPVLPETVAGQNQAQCTIADGNKPDCCSGTSRFFSQENNMLESFTRANVSAEAQYRCIQVANQMRAAGIYVYAIGLSGDPIAPPTIDFLQQVANDPQSSTFNPNQPVGAALLAPTGEQLTGTFQQIASQILLRLTQ